jgi:hypothetical protein
VRSKFYKFEKAKITNKLGRKEYLLKSMWIVLLQCQHGREIGREIFGVKHFT